MTAGRRCGAGLISQRMWRVIPCGRRRRFARIATERRIIPNEIKYSGRRNRSDFPPIPGMGIKEFAGVAKRALGLPMDFESDPMRLALYQPDIPQNAGAMLRLAACFGLGVDLILPARFGLDDARMRR